MPEIKDGVRTFYAKSRKAWRDWLEKNHETEKSVWLIIYKRETKFLASIIPKLLMKLYAMVGLIVNPIREMTKAISSSFLNEIQKVTGVK